MNPLEQYMLKLSELHEELKMAWDNSVESMTGIEASGRQKGLMNLLSALSSLQGVLTEKTAPHWLKQMQSNASALTDQNNIKNGQRRILIFRALSQAADQMQAHSFDTSLTDGVLPLVNLDEVVSKYHSQEDLDQTYDKAILAIQDALNSGNIDSIRIQHDLRRILATIEEAKQSSFVNQLFQIPNLYVYLKAVAKVSAKRVPVLNFVLEVVDEANQQLEQSNNLINVEIKRHLTQEAAEIEHIIEHQPLAIEHQSATDDQK